MRLAAVVAVAACSHAASTTLRLPSEREIGGTQVDRYEISLAAGQAWFASFDQLGADIVITTYDPGGRKLGTFDAPSGSAGVERVSIEAPVAGTYRLEVAPFPGALGRYRAHVDEIIPLAEVARRRAAERAKIDEFFAQREPFVGSFIAWAKRAAIRDVTGLAPVVGSARVVVLGEAEHGKHEYLELRNRLAKYLIEQHGFVAVVVESGWTEATLADDFIAGANIPRKDAAAGVFSWGIPTAMAENLELLEWLRSYNQTSGKRTRLYGMDLTGGRDGTFMEGRRAVDAALAFASDPALATRLAPLLPKFTTRGYLDLTSAQRSELSGAIADLVAAVQAHPTRAGFTRATRNAFVAATLDEFFRRTLSASTKDDPADPSMLGIRDAAMAATVRWILDQHPGGRVLVFTHNAHARRGPALSWPTKLPINVSMGQHLAAALGDQLVVIGTTHGEGKPTTTVDELLARVGPDRFVLDLRTIEPALREGLDREWRFRLDGWEVWGGVPWWSANPAACFDALGHTRTSTPVAPVP